MFVSKTLALKSSSIEINRSNIIFTKYCKPHVPMTRSRHYLLWRSAHSWKQEIVNIFLSQWNSFKSDNYRSSCGWLSKSDHQFFIIESWKSQHKRMKLKLMLPTNGYFLQRLQLYYVKYSCQEPLFITQCRVQA